MNVGDIVEGVVTYIGANSVSVRVGDYSGLLLNRDYDWLWDVRSIEGMTLGQPIKAVVTKVFKNERLMNLNAKQLKPDPFVISADKIIEDGYLISRRLPHFNSNRQWITSMNGGRSINLELESRFTVTVNLEDSLILEDELIVGDEYMFYAKSINYERRIIKLQLVGKI